MIPGIAPWQLFWFDPILLGAYTMMYAPLAAGAIAMGAERDLERSQEPFPFHVRVTPHKKVHFDTVADFEAFAPLAAASFFFYPFGLMWGGAFYGAAMAGAAAAGAAIAPFTFPMTPFAPFAPFAHLNSAAAGAHPLAAPVNPEIQEKMTKWYWSTLWFFHTIAYFSLFWQMSGLMWYWWGQTIWPSYSAYLQKVSAYWQGVYKQGADGYAKWIASLPKPTAVQPFPFFHPFLPHPAAVAATPAATPVAAPAEAKAAPAAAADAKATPAEPKVETSKAAVKSK